MTKLYVGNLPYSVGDEALAKIFADYGAVSSAVVIQDKMSGRSKGFGFIELEDDEAAQKAIEEKNGSELDGRNLVVSVARPMRERH